MPTNNLRKRLAPYHHADGSDCYTKNCSKNQGSEAQQVALAPEVADFFGVDEAVKEANAIKKLAKAMKRIYVDGEESQADPEFNIGKARRRLANAQTTGDRAEVVAEALGKLDYADRFRLLNTVASSKNSSPRLLMTLLRNPSRTDVLAEVLSNSQLDARNLVIAHGVLDKYIWQWPNSPRGFLWAALAGNENADAKVLHAVAKNQSAESDAVVVDHEKVSEETLQHIASTRPDRTYAYSQVARKLHLYPFNY